ncbi:MAG: UDP-N-acetylmuramoyl-tripeptide--D-alanyl-D-alanine ligase [Thermodesulfobacteriota bacterium]
MAARWGFITAGEIARAAGGTLIRGSGRTPFTALGTDSRSIVSGQVFWALKGERFDGHDFAAEALRQGAAGVVIRQDRQGILLPPSAGAVIAVPDTLRALGDLAAWWRHELPARVAAITGSVGKSTTKEMAASILGLGQKTLRNRGNLNNLVGLPLTLFQLEADHRAAVLEMGMNRPGEIARLTEIADPDVGLITNVARVHLEGLGDIQGVARAKVELVERSSPRARIILNGDDGTLMKTAAAFGHRIMTYGVGRAHDVRARNIRNLGRDGLTFDLDHEGGTVPVRLRIAGSQHVYNALGAAAIALSLDASPEQVREGLYAFQGIQGRFTLTGLPGGMTLVDDTYNSNPFALRAALESLRSLIAPGGRVIVGLGEMMELGGETESAHFEAGEMVAALSPGYFVAMGEHAWQMIEGALRKGFPRERAATAASHGEMARMLGRAAKEGDLIFIKGSRRMGLEKVCEILKKERKRR